MKNKTHQAPRALSMTPLAAAAMALLMGVTADIGAVGLGAAGSSATLGRPLDFAIPLRLEDGETLTAECLSADVYNGTQKVLPSDVRVRLMPGATPSDRIARVTTKSAIYEPVIEVELRAGCERRYTRRYTAFADPPAAHEVAPAVTQLARVDPLPMDKPVDAPAKAASRSMHIAANTTYAIAAAEQVAKAETKETKASRKQQRRGKGKPDTTTASAHSATVSTTASTSASANTKVAAAAPEAKRSRKSRGAADDVRARSTRLVLERAAPVLKMDMEEPVFVARSGSTPAASAASTTAAELLAAVTAAASAAPAAPQPVPADPGQLRALERKIADLKRQSLEHQQTNAALTARLAEAESRTGLTPWLWGLIGLLGLTAAGLGWRQFRQSHYQVNEADWWADSRATTDSQSAPATGAPEEPDSEINDVGDDLPSRAPQGNWDPEDPIAEATSSNRHLPDLDASQTGMDTGYGPVREVSAEELMDLDQQAAFLVGLGQDDAAVDLLKNHLRTTGGMSPLPYAKLLEVHYRREDRRAYDRVRTRYARRFGTEAPPWEVGPLRGRVLEDYPQIVKKINAMWTSPREAMGFLETVLFHADASLELLDLSAYDDVLLLYSIARELSTMPAAEPAANVDFELPLNEDPLPAIDAFPALAADVPAADIDPFNLPADSSKWLSAEAPAPATPAKNDAAGVQVTLDPSRLRA